MSDDPLEQQVNAFLQRSELLAASDRDEESLALVNEALALVPEHPTLLAQRAWILNKLDRNASALEAASTALIYEPDFVPALVQLSVAQMGIGDAPAAEASMLRGLELAPEFSTLHLLYAHLVASNLGTRSQKKHRRALAESHVDTALELNPEDPDGFRRASNIAWTLGKIVLAEYYVDRGLSLAPDNLDLLTLRADLTTASASPTGKYDVITPQRVALSEANKILRLDPQHRGARRKLFSGFWYEYALLTDVPIGLLAVVAVTFATSFRASGTVWSPLAGTAIVLIAAAVRLFSYFMVTAEVNPGFKRLVTRETPFSTVRRWLTAFSWLIAVLGAVSALFVRDALVIRWLIVALGLASLAALAASIIWQCSFPASSRRAGGFSNDIDSLARIRDYRGSLRARIPLRILGALVLAAVLSYFSNGGREDAFPVGMMALAAMILSPLAGILVMRRTEKKIFEDLPAGTIPLPQVYRRPGVVGLLLSAVVGCVALVILATNTLGIPVLPNQGDAIGSYETGAQPADTGQTQCQGRPANRLACMIKQNKERAETGYPGIDVTEIDIPDFDMTMPDLEGLAQAPE